MKSSLGTLFLKATLLIVLFAWCLSRPTCAQAGGKDQFSPGPVRPGNLDYRTELPQGYLKVYSAIDRFKDGDAWRSEEHTSELQSLTNLVCRLLLEKKKKKTK